MNYIPDVTPLKQPLFYMARHKCMANKILEQQIAFETPFNLSVLLDSRHWATIGKLCPQVNKANDTYSEMYMQEETI
jgi:hypothetical protein